MFDELKRIFLDQKVDEIIPFLQKLTTNEKKQLQPKLEELRSMGPYRRSEEPIFFATALVCCNKTQFKNTTRWAFSSGFEIYNQILSWYNPEWFSDFINEDYDGHPVIDYILLAEWEEKAYISLKPETIARAFTEGRAKIDFEKFPLTLNKHIWHIFEYETTINWSDTYPNKYWTNSFVKLTEENKIDRKQILQECLLTVSRNFNKNLTGWFVDLFNELKPTSQELIALQPQLFRTLHTLQTKALNNSLNCIKIIVTSAQFNYNDFLSYMPVLITSSVKSIVKSVTDIAEKIMQVREDLASSVCPMLCDGFVTKDEATQKRLAKLLIKYGDKSSLKEHLVPYFGNILKSVEPLLANLYKPEKKEESISMLPEELEITPLLMREDNKIQSITSFDDYVFFLTQGFDNNTIHDVFLVPVYIQRFHEQIMADNLYMLEPALKRAITISESWSNKIGLIHKLYAAFFIHYIDYLTGKFPDISANINQLIDKQNGSRFVNWRSKFMYPETYPFYFILMKVFNCIKNEEHFNLLSTPTHSPAWIDPEILVKRLTEYQNSGKEPFSYDLQYALQQCALDNTDTALEIAKAELNGELKELIIFLLDKNTKPKKDVTHPTWWLTASLIKYPNTIPLYIEEWGFADIPEDYLTGNFKWKIEKDRMGSNAINIILPPYHVRDMEKSLIAQYTYGKFRSKSITTGDIIPLMCTSPNNHDTINGHIISIVDHGKVNASDAQMQIDTLTALLELNLPFSYMDLLVLAVGMLSSNKTSRILSAEVWMIAARQQHVEHKLVGKNLGIMLNQKLYPVKRFTDIVENNLLIGSYLINKCLEELLIGVLSKIETPITNLKKLLEIYSELLALNNSKADLDKIPQLKQWLEESSLKKIVKQILE